MTRRTRLIALTLLLAAALLAAGTLSRSAASTLLQTTETPTPDLPTQGAEGEAQPTLAELTATPTTIPTETPLPSPTYTLHAPTRIPPTPVPQEPTPAAQTRITESALVNIQASDTLRVGAYFNAAPFTWLNERGEVDGYEADIINAIAIELGLAIEYVQVTRQNDDEMLLSGAVDVLIGQQTRSVDREAIFDFSHPYYVNEHRMVIRQGEPYGSLEQLAGHAIAVEIGSRSERALRQWSEASDVPLEIVTYLTESAALDALAAHEVDGVVGLLDSLRRAGRQQMSLVDEPVMVEPYAIVLRRTDDNFRRLLDRSLQRLKASGRLEQIYAEWFGSEPMDFVTLVPVYDELYEDTRGVDDFAPELVVPANPVRERLASGQPLRVAGIAAEGQDAPAVVRLMNGLNRALVEEMARRWNTTVEYVPDSVADPAALIASGAADLAVSVYPRWTGSDDVDYSLPYLMHGDRLLVPANSRLSGFQDMLGTNWIIGYFADDPDGEEQIMKYAEHFNVGQNLRTFQITRESDAIYTMTVEDNISAIFGDSLRLQALMRESDPSSVKLLDDVFDLQPVAFALSRGDSDFRLMVNTALQEMARDGTYQTLRQTHLDFGEPVTIPIWPQRSVMRPMAEASE